MERGKAQFTKEVFANITVGLLECMQQADSHRKKYKQGIHVSDPVSIEDLESQQSAISNTVP